MKIINIRLTGDGGMKEYKVYYFNTDENCRESREFYFLAESHRKAKDEFIKKNTNYACEKIYVQELTAPCTHDIFINPNYKKLEIREGYVDSEEDPVDDALINQTVQATSAETVNFSVGEYSSSAFVVFLNVLGWITITSGIICILSYSSNDSSYERLTSVVSSVVSIGSAMSLFISAHVIKTIEKCAFYLENLNKKN